MFQEKPNLGKENRLYKNSVFVDLFYEDETAIQNELSLYNALHTEQIVSQDSIQKFRIENVLYLNFRNDISFGVNKKLLIFGEHQSTVNFNMPLRSLMYIARGYEQLIDVRERYHKQQIYLPIPEFYVFYNGKESFPQEKILKLSDAFLQKETDMLELKVRVININPSADHPILKSCDILKNYGIFVETVRKYEKETKQDTMEQAIDECIQNGILKEYLIRKGSQVRNMLVAEYDYDLDIEVQREEAMLIGEKRGLALGEKRGLALGEKRGLALGEKRGLDLGIDLGIKQGVAVLSFIEFCGKSGISKEETIIKTSLKFSIPMELAEEYVLLYWNRD